MHGSPRLRLPLNFLLIGPQEGTEGFHHDHTHYGDLDDSADQPHHQRRGNSPNGKMHHEEAVLVPGIIHNRKVARTG